ncbi:PQQ-binding-like beta-propeller repeat protein [Streptomyces sp. NPDC006475]|uniref:protein kinase domain-containing protein n=1 Tax=Streptomyces sp. NPDC006475 TaxID=3155719 RepID=UPI0033A7491D
MLAPLTHDDPGEIGGHRLLARLGHGGMGTVYLARSATGRTLALKTMHARIASDPAARTRFHLETDAARIIGDHHGAAVFAADPAAETPWLATEYVLGPPLDDAVALCGPLPEASVRALGAALAGALDQLHASDVVHRDLKPSNIMITAYGPKIIDFGIARAAGDDRLTRTGTAAGTPAFMSPEQATGQEHTPAGDVFALAGVLVFAATGRGPFGTGQAADLLYRVRYSEPDLTGVPGALAPVLLLCLAKNPAHRPTTQELATELHDGRGQFADHLPDGVLTDIGRRATEVWQHRPYRLAVPADHAVAPTVPAPRTTTVGRRKALAVGAGSLLTVVGAGAGWWTLRGGKKPNTPSAKSPTVLWQRSIVTAPPADLGRPRLIGDRILVASEAGLTALDASTGRTIWSANPVLSPWDVATDGENLYAVDYSLTPTEGLRIVEIDPEDGSLGDPLVDTKAYNGKLLGNQLLDVTEGLAWLLTARAPATDADTPDSTHPDRGWLLAAFSLADGTKRSEVVLEEKYPEDYPWVIGMRTSGSLLVLFFRTEAGGVEALVCDRKSGKAAWRDALPLKADEAARSPMAVDRDNLYVASGGLSARRLSDGEEVWTYRGAQGASYGAPTVQDGVVYAVEDTGPCALVAVSATTGKLLWREKDAVRSENELEVAPTVDERFAYKHSAAGIRAIDLTTHASVWLHGKRLDRFSALPVPGLLIGFEENGLTALRPDGPSGPPSSAS